MGSFLFPRQLKVGPEALCFGVNKCEETKGYHKT